MNEVMLFLMIGIIIILCIGTPDLLDAVTTYVSSLSKVCP